MTFLKIGHPMGFCHPVVELSGIAAATYKHTYIHTYKIRNTHTHHIYIYIELSVTAAATYIHTYKDKYMKHNT